MNADPPAKPDTPLDSVKPFLDSWREVLIARTARTLVMSGGLLLLVVIASFLPHRAPLSVWLGVGFYGLGLLAMWATRRTPVRHAIAMLAPFVLLTPFLFTKLGISGSAFLTLTMTSVLAGILVGPRAATAFVVASLSAIAVGAFVVVGGLRPLGELSPVDSTKVGDWARIAVLWFAITSWIIFTVAWLTSRFEESLRSKDEAFERLRLEEAQRLEAEGRHHRAEMELIESQKREAIGRLAGGIAHDFNNSLLVILGWNALLEEGKVGEEQRRKGHAAIAAAGDAAAQLARHLLTISRRQVAMLSPTLLAPLVKEAAHHIERVLPEDIRVRVEIEPVPPVMVDAAQIHQILLNLALNARDAMPRGGVMTFTLRRASEVPASEPPGSEWVELVVSDDGAGMDEDTRARAFEPYFTTKGEGRGTGLGLATTHAIVVAAHGRIQLSSAPGKGTRVAILLPVGTAVPAPPAAAPATRMTSPVRGGRVAVVEDDEAARAVMVMSLRDGGYEVLQARNGEEALELLTRNRGTIDLLCVDGVVPGISAERVVDTFRRGHPGRPVLVCSGHVGSERLKDLIEHGHLPLLAKPFTGRELLARVGELMQAAKASRPEGS